MLKRQLLGSIRHACLSLFLLIGLPLHLKAETQTLTVEFYCPNVNNGSSEFYCAVWITNGSNYHGTLGYTGTIYSHNGSLEEYYYQMNNFDIAINSAKENAYKPGTNSDARLGPTETAVRNVLGRNYVINKIDVTSLPPGNYTIHFETVRRDNYLSYCTVAWTKTDAGLPRTLMTVTPSTANQALYSFTHPFNNVFVTHNMNDNLTPDNSASAAKKPVSCGYSSGLGALALLMMGVVMRLGDAPASQRRKIITSLQA
jgi:hypothetical protein